MPHVHTWTAAGFVLGRRNRSAKAKLKQRSFATSDPTLPNGRHSIAPEHTLRPIASMIAAARARREARRPRGVTVRWELAQNAKWPTRRCRALHTPPCIAGSRAETLPRSIYFNIPGEFCGRTKCDCFCWGRDTSKGSDRCLRLVRSRRLVHCQLVLTKGHTGIVMIDPRCVPDPCARYRHRRG